MGSKRKHQPVQHESDHEIGKSKSEKGGSKKKRARKNKNESIVKETSPPPELNIKSEFDADVKPDLNALDAILDEDRDFNETFAYQDSESQEEATIGLKSEQELPTWPTNDLATLLSKIDEILPEKDNLRFKSRLMKLDWESLRFGDYSSDQCRQMWEFVQKHVRCYRLLSEIINDAKAWVSQPWTSYRNHKKKPHPDMPRRPLTCYMIYYMRNKTKVLKKNPKMDMPALSKQIAEMYKNLSPTKKEKYMKMAATQRDEYIKKLNEFYKKHPELEPKTHKNTKVPSNVPKKPFYIFYESKLKDADEKIDRNLFLRKCKKKWKHLSDKQKYHWINLALSQTGSNTDAGDEAVTEYKKKMQNLLTKEERHLKEKIAGKPDKPPISAYGLFSRNLLATDRIQSINPKERIATIAQEWKQCSAEEKEAYKEKTIELINQYKKDYTAYLESLTEEERIAELTNSQPKAKKKKPPEDDETAVVSPETVAAPLSPVVEATTSKKSAEPMKKRTKKKSTVKEKFNNSLRIEEIESESNRVPDESISATGLYPNEPEPPPSHPIELFAKKILSSPQKKKKQTIDELWENLSIKEKENYRQKLNKLKNEYIVKYEKFLKSLTPDQLKQYSNMKKLQNINNSDESENDNDVESDEDDDDNNDGNENSEEDDSEKSAASSSSEDEDEDSDDSSN